MKDFQEYINTPSPCHYADFRKGRNDASPSRKKEYLATQRTDGGRNASWYMHIHVQVDRELKAEAFIPVPHLAQNLRIIKRYSGVKACVEGFEYKCHVQMNHAWLIPLVSILCIEVFE